MAERVVQSPGRSDVVVAVDRHDGLMLVARGDEGLPSEAPMIPVQSPDRWDFAPAIDRHDGPVLVTRDGEGAQRDALVIPVPAPPATSRPVLSYSSAVKPIGWIGSCLLHAGLVTAVLLIRLPVRPPQPWPENPATFHVIFEPPSPPTAVPAPAAPQPPKPVAALPPPRPVPSPPQPPVPRPERLAVAPAANIPAPPRPARKPPPPLARYLPQRRELPRHVALRPRLAHELPPERALPRHAFSRLPLRQELPRNVPVSPAPPVYYNIPTAPPRSAGREQIAAVPRPALPFVPPRPISYAAGNAPPEYPAEARERRWQGRVVLHVEVSPAGLPQDVRISAGSGYAMLDQAALRAVRGWRFVPATRGGVPVAGAAHVPVQFRLAE